MWEEISGGNDSILLGKREVNSRAYCSAFNFKGADQQKKVGTLSGGERNRVHLAKMLKTGANVLLLDEPTNDLDVDTLRALEEALEDFAGCAVIISHDRWFLDRIATHMLAFEGDSHVEWFEGNFQDYEEDKMRRLGADSTIRIGSSKAAYPERRVMLQSRVAGERSGVCHHRLFRQDQAMRVRVKRCGRCDLYPIHPDRPPDQGQRGGRGRHRRRLTTPKGRSSVRQDSRRRRRGPTISEVGSS